MNVNEAEKILGVNSNATKAEINAAYRRNISKYHPDANRDKPKEQRELAERLFKQSSEARKILLSPHDSTPSNNVPTQNANRNATQHNPRQNNASTSKYNGGNVHVRNADVIGTTRRGNNTRTGTRTRTDPITGNINDDSAKQEYHGNNREYRKLNDSTSFHDHIDKIPDDAERQIAGIYASETKSYYSRATDVFRLTPSIISTIIVLIITILSATVFIARGSVPDSLLSTLLSEKTVPVIIVILIKVFYDLIASYYIHMKIANRRFGWVIMCLIEFIVMMLILSIIFLIM